VVIGLEIIRILNLKVQQNLSMYKKDGIIIV